MSKSSQRALDGQVLVRMPLATAGRIADLAAADGITAASWSRRHLVAAAGSDPLDTVPIRAKRQPRPPAPEHILELARLREHVAELSGALVRAAVRTRTDGAEILHAEIEAVLPAVKTAVRDIDTLKLKLMETSEP